MWRDIMREGIEQFSTNDLLTVEICIRTISILHTSIDVRWVY